MPSISIYLPDDVLKDIEDRRGEDQSRSDWITQALRSVLEREHDDLEDLERRIDAIEEALVRSVVHGGEPAEYLDKVSRVISSGQDYLPAEELEPADHSTESDR